MYIMRIISKDDTNRVYEQDGLLSRITTAAYPSPRRIHALAHSSIVDT
jgi:hypothetical protein